MGPRVVDELNSSLVCVPLLLALPRLRATVS